MRRVIAVLIAGVGLLVSGAAVQAHHSFAAEFDANKPVTLRGTVTKMEWINPHAWIHIDVTNPDGTVSKWMIEGGAPNALLRRGWTKASLVSGTDVVVVGFQAKDGATRANGLDITFTDGRKLFFGSSSADPANKPVE